MGMRIKKALGYGLVLQPEQVEGILNSKAMSRRIGGNLTVAGLREYVASKYAAQDIRVLNINMSIKNEDKVKSPAPTRGGACN